MPLDQEALSDELTRLRDEFQRLRDEMHEHHHERTRHLERLEVKLETLEQGLSRENERLHQAIAAQNERLQKLYTLVIEGNGKPPLAERVRNLEREAVDMAMVRASGIKGRWRFVSGLVLGVLNTIAVILVALLK